MADIDLVIKIPEDKYKAIVEKYDTFPKEMKEWGLDAIKNGTVLPKGHGRLIDADKLTESILCKTFGLRSVDIENAPTIIPAERSDTE